MARSRSPSLAMGQPRTQAAWPAARADMRPAVGSVAGSVVRRARDTPPVPSGSCCEWPAIQQAGFSSTTGSSGRASSMAFAVASSTRAQERADGQDQPRPADRPGPGRHGHGDPARRTAAAAAVRPTPGVWRAVIFRISVRKYDPVSVQADLSASHPRDRYCGLVTNEDLICESQLKCLRVAVRELEEAGSER